MNGSHGDQRPLRRLTPIMLASLSCQRRFFLSYVRNFRRRGRRDGKWPPHLRDALDTALAVRDLCIASGEDEEMARNLQKRSLYDWCDQVHVDAPSMMSKEQKRDLLLAIEEIRNEAERITWNYRETHDYQHEMPLLTVGRKKEPVADKIVEYSLPIMREDGAGRRGRWSYACDLDSVFYSREGRVTLRIRHFTSRSAQEKAMKLPLLPWWAGHVWVAEQLIKREVEEIEFDVVKLKAPSEPQFVKCKKCSVKDGVLVCSTCHGTGFSRLSKSFCDTTEPVFHRVLEKYPHIHTWDAPWAEHDRLMEAGRRFAYRHTIDIRNQRSYIDSWLRDVYEITRQLDANIRNKTWPRNVYECSTCQFVGACTVAWKYENDAPFIRVNNAYPGL